MAFTILPPSFGRRCPEGAVVGFRSGLKRNEKMRFLLSSSCHARPPVSTVSESHDLLAGHANQKKSCEEMGIHFFTAPFYSKFRMRAPHDLDAILPEDTCKCFDFPAQLLISPIMTAADPEVDRIRMQLYDPLHLFLEPLVIFHGMPAAAAPHESLDLQRLLPIAGKGPRPLVERLKASRPRADTIWLKTC